MYTQESNYNDQQNLSLVRKKKKSSKGERQKKLVESWILDSGGGEKQVGVRMPK